MKSVFAEMSRVHWSAELLVVGSFLGIWIGLVVASGGNNGIPMVAASVLLFGMALLLYAKINRVVDELSNTQELLEMLPRAGSESGDNLARQREKESHQQVMSRLEKMRYGNLESKTMARTAPSRNAVRRSSGYGGSASQSKSDHSSSNLAPLAEEVYNGCEAAADEGADSSLATSLSDVDIFEPAGSSASDHSRIVASHHDSDEVDEVVPLDMPQIRSRPVTPTGRMLLEEERMAIGEPPSLSLPAPVALSLVIGKEHQVAVRLANPTVADRLVHSVPGMHSANVLGASHPVPSALSAATVVQVDTLSELDISFTESSYSSDSYTAASTDGESYSSSSSSYYSSESELMDPDEQAAQAYVCFPPSPLLPISPSRRVLCIWLF
jgi:hypothetical protein